LLLFQCPTMKQFPDEILGLIVDELDDHDRFGCFGLLSKKFNSLAFSLPYRRLIISTQDIEKAFGKPVFDTQELGAVDLSKYKGGLLTAKKKVDGAFVEEVRVEAGMADKRFLTEIMAICRNCRTLSVVALARLKRFDFAQFKHLTSLSIGKMDYHDSLTFGRLVHLSIRAKYKTGNGSDYFNITAKSDHVSKHIENIPTLKSLELNTDFFVSQAVLSKLPSYNVLPSSNQPYLMPQHHFSRADPYPYMEPNYHNRAEHYPYLQPTPQPPQPQELATPVRKYRSAQPNPAPPSKTKH